jgi:hypothetical protein
MTTNVDPIVVGYRNRALNLARIIAENKMLKEDLFEEAKKKIKKHEIDGIKLHVRETMVEESEKARKARDKKIEKDAAAREVADMLGAAGLPLFQDNG